MRRMRDPQQIRLFDPFQGVLSPMARKRIASGWQGLVRAVVLKTLPVATLAEHFSPNSSHWATAAPPRNSTRWPGLPTSQ